MFVKLMSMQTCDSMVRREEDKLFMSVPEGCLGDMHPGTVALVVHGRDSIEVYCRPCAMKRFGRTVDPH